uniref:Uncharacterized protein n=1 Tax=Lessardia elongata TaxID=210733 RepID=A0A7S2QW93_9DINO
MTDAAAGASVDFKVKEKTVLAHLLTIPEVANAVSLQRAGRSQEAKAAMRAAVGCFPAEILTRATATAPTAAAADVAATSQENAGSSREMDAAVVVGANITANS